MVKLFKGNVKELSKNEIASIFLLKILTTYDDTVTAKKYIVNDLVTNFEDLIQDDPEKHVERLYCGIFDHTNKTLFRPEIIEIFSISQENSSSQKDDDVR